MPVVSEYDRARIVLEYLSGASITELRRRYGVSSRVIEKVLEMYGLPAGMRQLLRYKRFRLVLEALEKAGRPLLIREIARVTGLTKHAWIAVRDLEHRGCVRVYNNDVVELTEEGRRLLEQFRELDRRVEEARRKAEEVLQRLTQLPAPPKTTEK